DLVNLAMRQAQLAADHAAPAAALVAPKAQLQADGTTFDAQEELDEAGLKNAINTDPSAAPLYPLVQTDQATFTLDLAQFCAGKLAYLNGRKIGLTDITTLNTDIAGNL